jgi:hypothetical protein
MLELFTNAKKTKKEKVDISAPAFSATKVQAALGLLITGIIAVVPASHKDDVTVIVASIAAATLIVLGMFALVAVDIRTRQRAHEAKLRFGGGGDGGSEAAAPSFQALPTKKLILQQGHSTDEYEVQLATVEKDLVQVIATRDGDSISATFKETPKPK